MKNDKSFVNIVIPVSLGELIDKITILEIKKANMTFFTNDIDNLFPLLHSRIATLNNNNNKQQSSKQRNSI